MHCLYCGNELGFLKELTDGEFCSRDHRQRYKRLTQTALARLISAEAAGATVEAPSEAQPETSVEILPGVPSPGFWDPAEELLALSGGNRIFSSQPIPTEVVLRGHGSCRLPGSSMPAPVGKPAQRE